jgi:SAM-dependent methyltransferase
VAKDGASFVRRFAALGLLACARVRGATKARTRIGGRRRVRRTPEEIQRAFYAATADRYDVMHAAANDEHYKALGLISALIAGYDWRSALDVGAGTGRGVRYLSERHPDVEVRGVEPVRAMIDRAEHNGARAGAIVEASGEALPFGDESFDAVFELGVLHHIAEPEAVVMEMTRVARRAVFLSDANRFGKGGTVHRVAKYGVYRLGLWPLAYRLATRGRGYHLNDGDGGVVYSYSVYDSLPLINEWADRTFLVPTAPARAGWFHPLFGAPTLLLCAIRDG